MSWIGLGEGSERVVGAEEDIIVKKVLFGRDGGQVVLRVEQGDKLFVRGDLSGTALRFVRDYEIAHDGSKLLVFEDAALLVVEGLHWNGLTTQRLLFARACGRSRGLHISTWVDVRDYPDSQEAVQRAGLVQDQVFGDIRTSAITLHDGPRYREVIIPMGPHPDGGQSVCVTTQVLHKEALDKLPRLPLPRYTTAPAPGFAA